MKIVIQCASSKEDSAGHIQTKDGKRVMFVAQPQLAPQSHDVIYARPDDSSDWQKSWRALLEEYNKSPGKYPWNLHPAYRLYRNKVYAALVQKLGVGRVYILSAGWGLVRADFLVPQYDITFSSRAEDYKRRAKTDSANVDRFQDFRMLPDDGDPLVFFGGKDYLPLFCKLTEKFHGRRTVYFNSKLQPNAPDCVLERYHTKACTNWHYECVKAILNLATEI